MKKLKTVDDYINELTNADMSKFTFVVETYLSDLHKRINKMQKSGTEVVPIDEFIETTDVMQIFLLAELERMKNLLKEIENEC